MFHFFYLHDMMASRRSLHILGYFYRVSHTLSVPGSAEEESDMERKFIKCLILSSGCRPTKIFQFLNVQPVNKCVHLCVYVCAKVCVRPRDQVSRETCPPNSAVVFFGCGPNAASPKMHGATRHTAVQTEHVAIHVCQSNKLVKKQLQSYLF